MSSIEQLILKATDESLPSDNWEFILNVCDKVNDDPDNGPASAITVLIQRLSSHNAEILSRCLSLILSLAENCGSKMKQEISSSKFTDTLYQLIENRRIHYSIKTKIIEIMSQLEESFRSDPSLKNVSKTLSKIKINYPDLVSNNSINRPNVPSKTQSNADSNDDDDELAKVLKLSLEEFENSQKIKNSTSNVSVSSPTQTSYNPFKNSNNTTPVKSNPVQGQNQNQIQNQTIKPEAQSPTTVSRVRALYDLEASEPGELSFKKGDVITVIENVYSEWWRGSLKGIIGIFPLNYVTAIPEPKKEDLLKNIEVEYSIMKESRNVDILLSKLQKLSVNDDPTNILNIENDEIFKDLYSRITPLRPKVSKLIIDYQNKQKDLFDLNNKLKQAEMTYNELLNASINSNNFNNNFSNQTFNNNFQQPSYKPTFQQSVQQNLPNYSQQNQSNIQPQQQQQQQQQFSKLASQPTSQSVQPQSTVQAQPSNGPSSFQSQEPQQPTQYIPSLIPQQTHSAPTFTQQTQSKPSFPQQSSILNSQPASSIPQNNSQQTNAIPYPTFNNTGNPAFSQKQQFLKNELMQPLHTGVGFGNQKPVPYPTTSALSPFETGNSIYPPANKPQNNNRLSYPADLSGLLPGGETQK